MVNEQMVNYLDILAETIRKNWDQPALTDFYLNEEGTAQDFTRGRRYTYGEMYQEIVRVANLLTDLDLQKGDHIAICGANSAHWVVAYLAIAKMQGVSVTVLHSLMPEDMAHQIDFSDAKALFTDEETWTELKDQSIPQVEHVISLTDWNVTRGEKISLPFREEREVGFPPVESDSLAMICFTSGSTGNAKGVMLSYRNMNNNAQIHIDGCPNDEKKAFLSLIPMAHVYGVMTEIITQLLKGAHIYILTVVSIEQIRNSIEYIHPYSLCLIPLLIEGLIRKYPDSVFFLNKCKQINIGGAFVNKNVEKELLQANVPISVGYGQTETGPLISFSKSSEHKMGTCGKIVDGMICSIAPNGEILVKGENVMQGYYKDPEATTAKIDKDGWLHTGDKGHLDEEGYLYVEGRLNQDMIILPNGENINPENIEAKINAVPEVKESIVLERDGHLVAIVVPSSLPFREESEVGSLRRHILRTINPQLPLFCQLYDLELTDQPLARTEKQTLKRYLYK